MGAVRLVILAVLAFIAWHLIRGIRRKSAPDEPAAADKRTDRDRPPQDVLVEDPVCRALVPKHQAIRMRRNGETYYFCSDACCDKFSETARGKE